MAAEDLRKPSQPFLFDPTGDQSMRQAVLQQLPDADDDIFPEGQEPIKVEGIRLVQPKDYYRILRWFDDEETQRHLSPLPKLPQEWSNPNQVEESKLELANYYDNNGEPEKITAFAAVNEKDKVLGVVTVRWRGDPWVPEGERIASVERLLVNPRIRGRGVGEKLVGRALEEIFENRKCPEARTWVMSDEIARGWGRIVEFFTNKFGFGELQHPDRSWAEYQKRRGIKPDGRDAKWHVLKREVWLKRKEDEQKTQRKNNNRSSTLSLNGSAAAK